MSEALAYLEQRAVFMAGKKDLGICEKVLVGLPMDATTSFRPGTRLAPFRIREVSDGLEEYSIYQDRSLEALDFYDAGDVRIPFGNVVTSLARMEAVAEMFLGKGKRLFSMGGEHLVSLPMIRTYHRYYPELVVVQMDAHADLRQQYLEESLSHATVMRHVVEELGPGRLYQMGIRSATREEISYAREHSHLYLDQFSSVVDEVIEAIGKRPVYVTLDIDVLDPAFAPGTGTPEPGGVSSREVLAALLKLAHLNVVGFDLVEVSPPFEKGDNTSILAAKILREALLAF